MTALSVTGRDMMMRFNRDATDRLARVSSSDLKFSHMHDIDGCRVL